MNFFKVVNDNGFNETSKGCYDDSKGEFADGDCHQNTEEGITTNFCVCKQDLCNENGINGVDKILPSMFMLLTSMVLVKSI